MTLLLDPLLAPRDTTHALQLQRYRCEYVLRGLWRIVQGRAHWQVAIARPADLEGGSFRTVGGGSLESRKAAFLLVEVPAHARLGIDEHQLRLWRRSLHKAWQSLKADEEFALEDWLNRERHNAIFRVEGATVRRNQGASEDLARAALKLMAAVDVAGGAR